MEYQKIINLLDNTPNQPTMFRTKNQAEINDNSGGMYNINSQIRFKASILRSGLCDYSDPYIHVKGAITVARVTAPAITDNAGKEVTFKKCAPFTDSISERNNTQIDNVQESHIVMPMYNLIEYSDNYSKTRSLWQHYRDELSLTDAGLLLIFMVLKRVLCLNLNKK